MEFNKLIESRRTRRDFDPDHSMSDSDLNYIINAARSTPTSFNIQNWRFVAIRDRGLKEKIKRSAWDQAQVATNSVLIAVCADLNAWDKDVGRYWVANGPEVAERMVGMTHSFYNGRDQVQRDEAMRSVGMAATAIMLAATDLGYSSSPMIGFDPAAVGEVINLPDDHAIGMLIAIGKSNSEPFPKTQLPLSEVLIYDFFPA